MPLYPDSNQCANFKFIIMRGILSTCMLLLRDPSNLHALAEVSFQPACALLRDPSNLHALAEGSFQPACSCWGIIPTCMYLLTLRSHYMETLCLSMVTYILADYLKLIFIFSCKMFERIVTNRTKPFCLLTHYSLIAVSDPQVSLSGISTSCYSQRRHALYE